jgi:hypothetical protein
MQNISRLRDRREDSVKKWVLKKSGTRICFGFRSLRIAAVVTTAEKYRVE